MWRLKCYCITFEIPRLREQKLTLKLTRSLTLNLLNILAPFLLCPNRLSRSIQPLSCLSLKEKGQTSNNMVECMTLETLIRVVSSYSLPLKRKTKQSPWKGNNHPERRHIWSDTNTTTKSSTKNWIKLMKYPTNTQLQRWFLKTNQQNPMYQTAVPEVNHIEIQIPCSQENQFVKYWS